MKSILYAIPNVYDAISWYRGLGPLGRLRKQMDISLTPLAHMNWTVASQHDILYMLRPSTDDHKKILEMSKRLGLKVWVDYDDHLLDVPDSNPASDHYSNPRNKDNVRYCIAHADVVSVSTEFLAKEFQQYRLGHPCVVIPNALHHRFSPLQEPNKIIMWRGSNTHEADLQTAHPFFIKTQDTHPDIKFVFFGDPDYRTKRIFKPGRMRVLPKVGIDEYFDTIKAIKPMFQIVPLEDNPFNRAKSNIAWLEATIAGAMTIATPLPEWERKNAIFNDFDISAALTLRNSYVEASRAMTKDALWIDNVNEIRKMIIETIDTIHLI